MVSRPYGQFCGLASALDQIGDRWTILVIRELLIGPRRYGDVQDNLPGIGPNQLSDRLRHLVQSGLADVGPTAGDGRGKLYRLTQRGEELREPLLDLAKWGMRSLTSEDVATGVSRAAWGFLAVQAMLRPNRVPQVNESYQFRVDDNVFHIAVHDGQVDSREGTATHPALTITADAATFISIGAQLLTPADAVLSGKISAVGDPAALRRCSELLGLDVLSSTPPERSGRGPSAS